MGTPAGARAPPGARYGAPMARPPNKGGPDGMPDHGHAGLDPHEAGELSSRSWPVRIHGADVLEHTSYTAPALTEELGHSFKQPDDAIGKA